MANQRKSKRIGCGVPVESKGGSVFAQTKTVDLSKGGLGLISRHKIPLNKTITVELILKQDDTPILAVGRVKWVVQIPASDYYRIGLSFEDVLRGSKAHLNKYFQQL